MAAPTTSKTSSALKTLFFVAAFDLVAYAALHFTTGGAAIGLGLAQFLDPVFQVVGLSQASAATVPALGSAFSGAGAVITPSAATPALGMLADLGFAS